VAGVEGESIGIPHGDSNQAYYEMMPKPGGSYEVRLFSCVECGHKWRES